MATNGKVKERGQKAKQRLSMAAERSLATARWIAAALTAGSAILLPGGGLAHPANPLGQPNIIVKRFDCSKQSGSPTGYFEFEISGDTEVGDDQGNRLVLRDGWHLFGDCLQLGHFDAAATGAGGGPKIVLSDTDDVQLWENLIMQDERTGPSAPKVIDNTRWKLSMPMLHPAGAINIGNRLTLSVQLYEQQPPPGVPIVNYSGPTPVYSVK